MAYVLLLVSLLSLPLYPWSLTKTCFEKNAEGGVKSKLLLHKIKANSEIKYCIKKLDGVTVKDEDLEWMIVSIFENILKDERVSFFSKDPAVGIDLSKVKLTRVKDCENTLATTTVAGADTCSKATDNMDIYYVIKKNKYTADEARDFLYSYRSKFASKEEIRTAVECQNDRSSFSYSCSDKNNFVIPYFNIIQENNSSKEYFEKMVKNKKHLLSEHNTYTTILHETLHALCLNDEYYSDDDITDPKEKAAILEEANNPYKSGYFFPRTSIMGDSHEYMMSNDDVLGLLAAFSLLKDNVRYQDVVSKYGKDSLWYNGQKLELNLFPFYDIARIKKTSDPQKYRHLTTNDTFLKYQEKTKLIAYETAKNYTGSDKLGVAAHLSYLVGASPFDLNAVKQYVTAKKGLIDWTERNGNNGMTVFYDAVTRSPLDEDLLEYLIKSGADIYIPQEDGVTPLMMLARNDHHFSPKLYAIFDELVNKYQQEGMLNVTEHKGCTVLNYAYTSADNTRISRLQAQKAVKGDVLSCTY